MTDIFVSYAANDRPRIKLGVDALEQLGWSVGNLRGYIGITHCRVCGNRSTGPSGESVGGRGSDTNTADYGGRGCFVVLYLRLPCHPSRVGDRVETDGEGKVLDGRLSNHQLTGNPKRSKRTGRLLPVVRDLINGTGRLLPVVRNLFDLLARGVPLFASRFYWRKPTMTPRSIRRAQERKARKEMERKAKNPALKAERSSFLETASSTPTTEPLHSASLCWSHAPEKDATAEPTFFAPSAAQLTAKRANAQFSSGPKTQAGKAALALNAVTTGLTGRAVLLPSDDAPAYEQHLRAYADDLRPVGARECDLVQSIADTPWRLKRIPGLEAAIFAQGHIEFGGAFNDHVAELRQLQQERRAAEAEALETVANRYRAAKTGGEPFEPSVNGFVFSTGQIDEHLDRVESRNRPVRATKQAA